MKLGTLGYFPFLYQDPQLRADLISLRMQISIVLNFLEDAYAHYITPRRGINLALIRLYKVEFLGSYRV